MYDFLNSPFVVKLSYEKINFLGKNYGKTFMVELFLL